MYLGLTPFPISTRNSAIAVVHLVAKTGVRQMFVSADPAMQRAFHLVRYEMRGHGRSGKPLEEKDYASARIAEDFKTVCDAFGVVKPVLVGWCVFVSMQDSG